MSDCVSLSTCPFFNDKMAQMPNMAEIFKTNYCRGDSSLCGRFFVASRIGKESVPFDLYPNDLERAKACVAGQMA